MSGRWVNVADQAAQKPDHAEALRTAERFKPDFPIRTKAGNLARAYLARTADNAQLAAALRQMRREYGAYQKISGETLIMADSILAEIGGEG